MLAKLPDPHVLASSAVLAACAGLNLQQHQSGISINRPAWISKIGKAVLLTALYMLSLSAMRYNPAIATLVGQFKDATGKGGRSPLSRRPVAALSGSRTPP